MWNQQLKDNNDSNGNSGNDGNHSSGIKTDRKGK